MIKKILVSQPKPTSEKSPYFDIAEKFVGNEILSPNEVRAIVGFKPVADQQADELRNRRLNQESGEKVLSPALATNQGDSTDINQNGSEVPVNENSPEIDPDNLADMTMEDFKRMIEPSNTT